MTAKRSTNWFWSDWAGDLAVRRLSPAERGLWIDLLALAAVAAPIGYVCDDRGDPLTYEEIARFANCSPTEAESLIAGILKKGAASRDRTGRLFNRRMVRDLELSEKKRRAGKVGAAATALRWQAFNGVPGQVPGHVPRHTGTRASSNKNLTSNLSGIARARASGADAPQQKSGSATDPGDAKPRIKPTSELAATIESKGWTGAPEPVRRGVDASDDLASTIRAKGWVQS